MKTRNLLLSAMFAGIAVVGSFAQTVITATAGTDAVVKSDAVPDLVTYTLSGVSKTFVYLGDVVSGYKKPDQTIDFNFNITTAGIYTVAFEYLNRSADIARGEYIWVNGHRIWSGQESLESGKEGQIIGEYQFAPTKNVGGAWSEPSVSGINTAVGAVYLKAGQNSITVQTSWGYTYWHKATVTLLTSSQLATTSGIAFNGLARKLSGTYVVPVNSPNVAFTGDGIKVITTPGLPIPIVGMWGESDASGGKNSQQTIYTLTVPSAGVYSVGFDHINTTGSEDRATDVIINNCLVANVPAYVTGRAVYNTTAGGFKLDENLTAPEIAATPYVGTIGRSNAGIFNLNAGKNTIRLRSAWGYMWFGSLHVSTTTGTVTACNFAAVRTITGSTSLMKGKTGRYIVQTENTSALPAASSSIVWTVVGTAATIANTNVSKTQLTLSGVNEGVVKLVASFDSDPTVKFELTVTVTGVTSTSDEISSLVSVYPNPTTGEVNVSAGGLSNVSVAVYNLVGSLVKASSAETSFKLSTPGVYLVEVKSGNAVTRKKLVVE